jgi:hypothetical protein
VNDDDVIAVIREHPTEAAAALAAIPAGAAAGTLPTAESLAFAARMAGTDVGRLWLAALEERDLVAVFVGALRARGVAFPGDPPPGPAGNFSLAALTNFLPRARSFRCRIVKDGAVAGSGLLVGPSLVLTAWHVIAVDAPGKVQEPAPKLEVLLEDGTRQAVRVPVAHASMCGDAEYQGHAPTNEKAVAGRHDVALLAMDRPVASHLGHVEIASPLPGLRTNDDVVLVHFPDGATDFVGTGKMRKIRRVTARWRHSVGTLGGSSGGGCFNRELQLIGIHQGELLAEGRFVPLERFVAPVLEQIARDREPAMLWSLDGTPAGVLVVGRGELFRSVAVAGNPGRRVRGVRIKRRAIDAGSAGLAFSHDILVALLARRGVEHRVVRVTQDEIVPDLVAEIRRRAARKGIKVPAPPTEPGVAPGAAPPETTAKDRAAILASAVDDVAAAQGLTVWFFFDNPTTTVSEAARLAFEGFVGAALVQPHLRLVIAGFETLPLPGEEFRSVSPFDGDGPPGLAVEIIGGFRSSDVKDMLSAACRDLTGAVDVAAVENATATALVDVPNMNGVYEDDQLKKVTRQLRRSLRVFAERGAERRGGGG